MSEEQNPTTCERFDAHLEELALGHVEAPLRGELLVHASACPHCHTQLDALVTVTDRLLLAAPEVEPPPGFEARVLDAVGDAVAPPARHARRGSRWMVAAAAAFVVAVGALSVWWAFGDPAPPAQAAIVTTSGEEVGMARLVESPTPHVLITLTSPGGGEAVRTCELQAPDGSWQRVGSWQGADVYSGVWAAGIDGDLLEAPAMRITVDGETVATADFD